MQTFHIISNTMVKSAQHHRPSLNLLLQQHKFPEVQDLVWGFFTWTQPQQPVLGMSHRAHFSMVSCRSIRQNYSPLTISPLWAALGISKPSGVAEATETAASNLHWRNCYKAERVPEPRCAQMCLRSLCRWQHMCDLSLQLLLLLPFLLQSLAIDAAGPVSNPWLLLQRTPATT